MIVYTPPKPAQTIPVIDIAGSYAADAGERRRVAWEIHKTCRDTGFFYIVNHGVPAALMQRQLQFTREFFAQPPAAKQALDLRNSPCTRGYEQPLMQRLDTGSPPDLKESFAYACELGPDHPYVQQKVPGQGANQWPADWPEFRLQMEEYQRHMIELGRHLLACIALSLELPEDYFAAGLEQPMCGVRLLRYPPQPADAAFNQLGAGAHTDWGSVTLLLQDGNEGLEVQNAAGEWLRARPVPGSFVINIGQLMQRLTNGLYHATMHRVMNNVSGRARYSVATFFDFDYFHQIECVPTCLPEHGPPQSEPCTVGEHIEMIFRQTYGG